MLVIILMVIAVLAMNMAEDNKEVGFFAFFFLICVVVVEFLVNLVKFIIALIKAIFFGGVKNGN